MTVEEKAKAYDEALEQARFYHVNCPSEPERKKLEGMFPVLCESEDERIRKEIVSALKFANVGGVYDKHIAYLEKQKDKNFIELTDDVVLGLDRALMIVKDAQGVLPSYQTDDGIYECEHAVETLESILKTV